jgi:hypothetical protein
MTILILFISVLFNLEAKTIIIDNFNEEASPTKEEQVAPKKWTKGNKKNDLIDYYIVEEGENKFLRGKYIPRTSGKIIYLDKKIDIQKTPFLSWKWRANKFPGTKTRGKKEEADNVATVYVLFKKGWTNYLIKYSWSQINCKNNDEGSPEFFRSKSSRSLWNIYIMPLRCTNNEKKCCSDPSGKWLSEKVNLIEDFKIVAKKDWIPKHIEGIGILVDGDQTKIDGVSADFDDFVLSSK